ncbi:MAG: hypothetical protein R2794_00965 [Chitinophagales bacterium]
MINIHLLSGPRNISTAMMYAFAQRASCTVVDEPLYAAYLQRTGLQHPGREEVLLSQDTDPDIVIRDVIFKKYGTKEVFFKHMTHHLEGINLDFLLEGRNILLLRDPEKVLRSYSKVIAEPTVSDIGLPQARQILDFLKWNNAHYYVLDADVFLSDPARQTEALCSACDIPFDPNMLHWEPGARTEDGVWAKYWYANVHKSTGFTPFHSTEEALPEKLLPVLEQAQKIYTSLLQEENNQA